MPTQWSGRPPASFTQTAYNANIDYDSDIPYDGMIVFNTQWTGRPSISKEGGFLLINSVDRLLINTTDKLIISVASSGTNWTGRNII